MKRKDSKLYARAFYEAVHNLRGKELTVALERFVQLLAREARLKQADRIMAEFERYGREQEGVVEIEVTSSRELTATTLNHIKKAFGDKVEASEKVNPDLLGGVVVRTRDTILDGSLKTQLHNLRVKLSL